MEPDKITPITEPKGQKEFNQAVETNKKEMARAMGVPKSLPVKHYRYVCAGCTNNAGFTDSTMPIPVNIVCEQCGKVQPFNRENLIEL